MTQEQNAKTCVNENQRSKPCTYIFMTSLQICSSTTNSQDYSSGKLTTANSSKRPNHGLHHSQPLFLKLFLAKNKYQHRKSTTNHLIWHCVSSHVPQAKNLFERVILSHLKDIHSTVMTILKDIKKMIFGNIIRQRKRHWNACISQKTSILNVIILTK
jgi:hypothetical protein